MKYGDLVVRKSYGGDLIFRIEEVRGYDQVLLRGVTCRLMADAPLGDLELASPAIVNDGERLLKSQVKASIRTWDKYRNLQQERTEHRRNGGSTRTRHSYFEVPGKVLHVDGDASYLQKCMFLYRQLKVPAAGYYVPEAQMASALSVLLPREVPDIVILTGHDGIIKNREDPQIQSLSSYKNSYNFVLAVKEARNYERSRDTLVIIAGACQSHFEALLEAGANFASSPARVLIHALDPLYIAAKVAFTSIKDTVHISDVLQHTVSGLDGLGGLETRGTHRIGLPKISAVESQSKPTVV